MGQVRIGEVLGDGVDAALEAVQSGRGEAGY